MTPPRILIIAGSDSGGGAGIQADIKTVTMLGGYAMTAVTALTAQDTLGVHAVEPASAAMVAAQIDACLNDIGTDAIKIGMLGSAEIAAVVADRLEGLTIPIVFDPVMVATSGGVLADAETIACFYRLMALSTLTTPNTEELATLAELPVVDEMSTITAAELLLERTGCPAILAKGGHLVWGGETYGKDPDGKPYRYDNTSRVFDSLVALDADNNRTWDSPRIDTRHTHGTGCTLASAIATHLGAGFILPAAVEQAREFVRAALEAAPGFGAGNGPLGHAQVRGLSSS